MSNFPTFARMVVANGTPEVCYLLIRMVNKWSTNKREKFL